MRKTIWALALALVLPVVGHTQVYDVDSRPLAVNWDVDGEAADDDQVVLSSNLVDSASFTITANPDVCRLVDITVTDANSSITAGVLTVTGTDCWGDPLVATFTFAAGGSGVKTLAVASTYKASGAYFATITAASVSTLTGEDAPGTDLVKIGYTSNSQYGYSLYGKRMDTQLAPYRWVDVGAEYLVKLQIKQGSTPTTLTEVTSGTNPFTNVAVGDLLGLNVVGASMPTQWRKVTVRTDAANVTIDFPIVISPNSGTTGQSFVYRKWFLSTDPQDGWIPMSGKDAAEFLWHETTTGANTGGLVSNVECAFRSSTLLPAVQVDTDTVATGSTGAAATAVDLRLAQFDVCRLGLKFGTGDDTDATAAATEGVYISVGLRR